MFSSKRNLILLLIGITFLAYFSSLGNPFIWDDEQFITSNQYVQRFDIGAIFTENTIAGTGLLSNYYRPLATLSFAIDAKIWSSNVFGFHLTNLLFHIGAGVLLFLLLEELINMKPSISSGKKEFLSERNEVESKGKRSIPAFIIALFFLIHPIQTEAVTYINSRGDSMYAFFLFASLWLFTKSLSFWGREHRGLQNHPSTTLRKEGFWIRYAYQNDIVRVIAVVFLFILSLLSKETALAGVGLFFLITLFQILKDKTLSIKNFSFRALWVIISSHKWRIAFLLALLMVTCFYMALRFTILYREDPGNFYMSQNEYTRSLAIRLFTFCKVLWIYIGLLIWPSSLHMDRVVSLVRSFFSQWVLSVIGLLVTVGIVGWWQVKKSNPWILFGAVWFIIMLVPSSGIVPINGMLYEHWLYVPMVGFFIMLYGVSSVILSEVKNLIPWVKIFRFTQDDKLLNKFLISFAIIISSLFLILTIRQNNIWSDPVRFYQYTLSFEPDSARLHNNLGMTLANSGKVQEAVSEYKKSIFWDSTYMQPHYDLANAYVALKQYNDAESEYQKALKLKPTFIPGRMNLLILYINEKQFNKALPQLVKLNNALRSSYKFQLLYGDVLWKLGQRKEAEEKFTSALLLTNNDPQMEEAISAIKSGAN